MEDQLLAITRSEIRRRLFVESIPRLKKCLAELSEVEVWQRPNAASNSTGNLILHLCGNVRQYLVSALGKQADNRERQKEFDATGGYTKSELEQALDALQKDVEAVLPNLTVADLVYEYDVQGFREQGLAIVIHVIEHFSYHTGQITWFVKALKDKDLGYYAGLDLDITS